MSKYVYRTLILALGATLSLVAQEPNQANINAMVQNISEHYRGYENNATLRKQILEQYGHLLNTGKHIESVKALELAKENSMDKINTKAIFEQTGALATPFNPIASEKIQAMKEQEAYYQEKIDTFFYFYSESLPPVAMERFYEQYHYLKGAFNEVQGYVVMVGFPDDFKNFAQRYKDESIGGGKVKFHPLMYKYFQLENVPAYAYAKCPREFKFSECEEHMLVRGDISFARAIGVFADEEMRLKPYQYRFTDAK